MVRFRRFCHRVPTESQLLTETLQFGLLLSSFLSSCRKHSVGEAVRSGCVKACKHKCLPAPQCPVFTPLGPFVIFRWKPRLRVKTGRSREARQAGREPQRASLPWTLTAGAATNCQVKDYQRRNADYKVLRSLLLTSFCFSCF